MTVLLLGMQLKGKDQSYCEATTKHIHGNTFAIIPLHQARRSNVNHEEERK